jgi:LPS sulfotransferase NodH
MPARQQRLCTAAHGKANSHAIPAPTRTNLDDNLRPKMPAMLSRTQPANTYAATEDRLFGADYDLPPAPVRRRYLILSSPRSGSTMLCSALIASGHAGYPMEYLSPQNIARYRAVRGHWSATESLLDFEKRRTSRSGCFGMKLHASQYVAVFGAQVGNDRAGGKFLRGFDRFIVCHRRGKVEQAVSNILANERKVWNYDGADELRFAERHFRPLDTELISTEIARMAGEERFWRETVEKLALPALDIAYEDLAADAPATLARAFAFLGLPAPAASVRPTTRRLADEANARLKAGYLAAIGAV